VVVQSGAIVIRAIDAESIERVFGSSAAARTLARNILLNHDDLGSAVREAVSR
jgi:hypothetical protein